jgi:hypothetical protein
LGSEFHELSSYGADWDALKENRLTDAQWLDARLDRVSVSRSARTHCGGSRGRVALHRVPTRSR